MASKRPTAEATSSSSDEEEEEEEASSSSDEEKEEAPLSSPSHEKTTVQKKPANPPAPAPQAPKPHPSQHPAAASSDEDEDDSEDEEETSASESDDDGTLKQPQPPPQPSVPKTAPQPTASGSSDGSGSGSEEESSDEEPAPVRRTSRGADPSIKPISSKPMDETSQPKKPAAANPSLKKAKTTEHSENDGSVQKRPLFQRLWSPDDEITILSGLVEYRSKKGTLPSFQEMDQLHNLIRRSLQVEVSNNQLNDKIRRLKKKFETSLGRGKNGADPTFSKAQERTVFELSKKIWGVQKIVSEDAGASSGEEYEGEESDSEMAGQQNVKEENALKLHDGASPALPLADGSVKLRYPFLSGAVAKMANECKCGAAMKRALENIEDPKARAMEEKVKKLKMGEMKLNIRRMDLMKETVKHIFEAIAKSDL